MEGSVDLHDQNRQYYNPTLKAAMWWKYLFFGFYSKYQLSIINYLILYKENVEKLESHLQFRLSP